MAYIDDNAALTPGGFYDLTFREEGSPDQVSAAVHVVKTGLAKDPRFNYQGSRVEQRDDGTYLIVTVQVRAVPKVPMVAVPALDDSGTWRLVLADSMEGQLWEARNDIPLIMAGVNGAKAAQVLKWVTLAVAAAGISTNAVLTKVNELKNPITATFQKFGTLGMLIVVAVVLIVLRRK